MLPGTPAPTAPHRDAAVPAAAEDESGPALHALRAASARVAEIGPDATAPDGGVDADDHAFDAAEHATRFEELHEALSAVLAELDRT